MEEETYINSIFMLPNINLKNKLNKCIYPNTDDETNEDKWLNNFKKATNLHTELTNDTLEFFK